MSVTSVFFGGLEKSRMAILNIQRTTDLQVLRKHSQRQEAKLIKGVQVTSQPRSSVSCVQCQPWKKSQVVYKKFP